MQQFCKISGLYFRNEKKIISYLNCLVDLHSLPFFEGMSCLICDLITHYDYVQRIV